MDLFEYAEEQERESDPGPVEAYDVDPIGRTTTGMTLAHAQDWLRERVADGARCPCCERFAKIYKRKINSGMAVALLKVYRHNQTEGEITDYAYVPKIIGYRAGDWAKLAHWGLIEELETEREDGGRAGWWRITEKGLRYARGEVAVPKYIVTYDGEFLGFAPDEPVDIHDALGSKFNLRELLEQT